MAKTLIKIVDSIKIDLKVFVDDHWLANLDEFIADKVHGINQTLMRQEYNNNKFIDPIYYQEHNCLEVECVQDTCTLNGVTFTFKGDLHKVEFPKLLSGVGDANIKYFGYFDMMHDIPRVSFDGLRAMDFRRYAPKEPVCAIMGQYALIKNLPNGLATLKLIALMHNPIDACTFREDETPYPTPSEYNLELLVKKDLLSTWNIPYEERNDTRGVILMPQQPKPKEND